MQSEQVVTLQIITIPCCFFFFYGAQIHIYIGYESHLEVHAILVIVIYIDLVTYIAVYFEWVL